MASRASLHPNAAPGAPRDASAIKERQIHVLADRLAELSNRVVALDGQIKLASAHAEIMRDFAGQQAALAGNTIVIVVWKRLSYGYILRINRAPWFAEQSISQVQISTNVVVNTMHTSNARDCTMHTQHRAGPDILQYHTTGKQPQSKGVII